MKNHSCHHWCRAALLGTLIAFAGCGATKTGAPSGQPRSAQDDTSGGASNSSLQAKSNHLRGKFVWFELVTTDPDQAAAFYARVLGWRITPGNANGGKVHDIANGERKLGLIKKLEPASNLSTHWMGYVSVPDLDAASHAVQANGGKVVVPATEIPGVGRFATVADPEGSMFSLFTSTKGDLPDHDPAPGDWIWNELWSKDPSTAFRFYAAVGGYSREDLPLPNSKYPMLIADGAARGGINNLPQGQARALWVPYVKVADADVVVKKAESLGAVTLMKPTDLPPVGRFAVLVDPTGAIFGLVAQPSK
jgi:predicted enzyme related to lactoylglutathione lyase